MSNKPLKVSVVMASYLGDYSNAATDRVRKFNRAVNSFLSQNYTEKELIVVSDGCSITINEISKYLSNPNIKIYGLDKQTNFSGTVRDLGVEKASGDIICYLLRSGRGPVKNRRRRDQGKRPPGFVGTRENHEN